MEWREKGEATLIKAKTRISPDKVLVSVFYDLKGVLLVDFLHKSRTMNAAYCCLVVLDEAKLAYRRSATSTLGV